jgi:hypothetical protein
MLIGAPGDRTVRVRTILVVGHGWLSDIAIFSISPQQKPAGGDDECDADDGTDHDPGYCAA